MGVHGWECMGDWDGVCGSARESVRSVCVSGSGRTCPSSSIPVCARNESHSAIDISDESAAFCRASAAAGPLPLPDAAEVAAEGAPPPGSSAKSLKISFSCEDQKEVVV